LVTLTIFFSLRSPESPALLEWAEEMAREHQPFHMHVVFLAEMTNETERHIAYSWIQAVDFLGTRNACVYMIEGFKGSFKRAYSATLPEVSWSELMKELPNSTREERFIGLQNYSRSRGLTDVAVLLNGEFLQERPIFQAVQERVLGTSERLIEAVKEGRIANWSALNITDWYKENGMLYDHALYPVKVGLRNYLTIRSFSPSVVRSVANKLAAVAVTNEFRVPVITAGRLGGVNLTEEERRFLRFDGPMTIVGGLVFKGELDDNETDYAVRYSHFAFFVRELPANLTASELLLVLFLRSTMALERTKRGATPLYRRTRSPSIRLNASSPLTWRLCVDPFSLNYRALLYFAVHVCDSGAATLVIAPAIEPEEYKEVPAHFEWSFASTIGVEAVEVPVATGFHVQAPSVWVYKERDYIVSRVISFGFVDGGTPVKIGDLYKAPLQENGYVQVMLPVGAYAMQGTVERRYLVDSFLPHPRFYRPHPSPLSIPRDSTLNVLTFATEASRHNALKTLIYSIETNTSAKVKLWATDDTRSLSFRNIDHEILPNYWPFFIEKPPDHALQLRCWKFALAEIYLPPNSQFLFADSNVVFRGDASRLQRLPMQTAVAAAPIQTGSWWHRRDRPWMEVGPRRARMNRPCHTVSVVLVDLHNWMEAGAGVEFRQMLALKVGARIHLGMLDEDLFNVLQLKAQVLSLPEEAAYCNERSPERLAKKALAVVMCTKESSRLSGIRYEELKKAAIARH
jgi:hypothetical protein